MTLFSSLLGNERSRRRCGSERSGWSAREQDKDLSLNAAVHGIGPRVATGVKPVDVDAGRGPGTTPPDPTRIKAEGA